MKRKLLKQIFTQWRSNVWLVMELVIISVVTWFMVDILCQAYTMMTEPKGFEIDNCYKIKVALSESEEVTADTTMNVLQQKRELISRLRHYPGVEGVAISTWGLEPYSGSMSSGNVVDVTTTDSVTYGFSDKVSLRMGMVNPDFVRVFRIRGARGESPESIARELETGSDRMLLSSNALDLVEDNCPVPRPDSIIGHRFMSWGHDYTLAGVIQNVKRDEFTAIDGYAVAMFPFVESSDDFMRMIDNGSYISIRIRAGEDGRNFMERFRDDMRTHFNLPAIYVADIIPFEKVRDTVMSEEMKSVKKLYLVIGFLLINVFLGLLGTFWYRTKQRTSELAVRMSFGATRGSLFRRLISEGLLLLVVATVIAMIVTAAMIYVEVRPVISYPVYELDVMWIIRDSVITFMLLAVMIVLGIWMPAHTAMKVNPAIALHDE